ncbi:MAG: hypothetical protein PF568_05790 [Deltaproteobacteria bacterium]|nr:hypothetical protein [Deltaproteobacteria bacterium]
MKGLTLVVICVVALALAGCNGAAGGGGPVKGAGCVSLLKMLQ